MALNDFFNVTQSSKYTHFDKIMKVQLLYRPSNGKVNAAWKSFIIECNPGGPKPGLSFHTEMMPGGVATQFKLTIKNFTSEIDIGIYSHMVITMQYRTSPMFREFTAAIFSAYIETPNPNGNTTFTGLIGDWFIDGVREESRNIIFRNPTITIEKLIWGIVEGKGPKGIAESPDVKNGGLNLSLNVDLPEWVLQDVIVVGKPGQKETTYWTESGYACLNWLLDRISVYGDGIVAKLRQQGMDQLEADKYRVMATLQDNLISIFMKGFTKENDNKIIRYVDLNRVTSVMFQGAALNVIAPWNPLVMPGGLFHMESKYFRGRMSPQQVIDKVARDPADLYRVITMSVDYETNGPANSMKLLAVKSNAFVTTEPGTKELTAIEQEADVKTNIYVSKEKLDIVFDSERIVEVGERKSAWGITESLFSESDGIIRVILPGETLGSIANEVYGGLQYYKTPAQGNIDYINEIITGSYFWPIIAIGNYCMRLKNLLGFETYQETPEQLIEGKKVFIPTVTNLDTLTSLHDILLAMAEQFETHPDNAWSITPEDLRAMRVICYYMELA